MDSIVSFFQSIGDAIIGVIDFVISLIGDLVWLVQTLGWALQQLPAFVSWIPPELSVLILSIFAVVVIYKIMGREG